MSFAAMVATAVAIALYGMLMEEMSLWMPAASDDRRPRRLLN
jgi:hypothetical protein